jgi:hypothetical protein
MMTRRLLFLLVLLLVDGPAFALDQHGRDPAPARPQSFEAVVRCRAIADDAARLACFDQAVAALQTAQERRDIVMVDRQQVREGRRRLFGLALPRIPIFGGGDDDDHDEDAVRTLESTVSAVATVGYGQYQISLADGSVWVQVDNNTLAVPPRAGHRIVINRGALGSYMMRVNNQPGIRVRRVR